MLTNAGVARLARDLACDALWRCLQPARDEGTRRYERSNVIEGCKCVQWPSFAKSRVGGTEQTSKAEARSACCLRMLQTIHSHL